MKTLLEYRIARLEGQKHCPCCSSRLRQFARSPEFFPDAGDEGYLFADGIQVAAVFHCAAEFGVDRHGVIVATIACGQPSIDAADAMQEKADEEHCYDEEREIVDG